MNQVDPVIDASMKGEIRVGPLPSLYLLDSRKAHLPEFSAYAAYFDGRYQVKRISRSALSEQPDLGRSIVWQFMGLAWSSVPAGCVVHDYRSLSTGRLSRLKDCLKKRVNVKPDVRVFLNAMVRDEMGFQDGVPEVLLDMGVPDWISDYSGTLQTFDWEYCYVGEISRERESHRLLDAYLSSDCCCNPLLMIGRAEHWILSRYGAQRSIEFAGSMSQRELFGKVEKCRYGICHLPVRRPYCYQTPTKLLEYAALHRGILANEHPSARSTAERLGIHVNWLAKDVFSGADPDSWTCGNSSFDARSIGWTQVIGDSGIEHQIASILDSRK